jgi:hypothetical protein
VDLPAPVAASPYCHRRPEGAGRTDAQEAVLPYGGASLLLLSYGEADAREAAYLCRSVSAAVAYGEARAGGELAFAVACPCGRQPCLCRGASLVPSSSNEEARVQLDTREMLLSPASPCLVASRLIMRLISSIDLDVVAVIF